MGEMLGKTAYAALAEVLFSIEIPFFKLVAEGINDNILLRQLSAENALLMARARGGASWSCVYDELAVRMRFVNGYMDRCAVPGFIFCNYLMFSC